MSLNRMIRKADEKGFTLIELMIVVAIIGILAAIAVPQFMAYRTRSYNAAAKALVHNLNGSQSDLNAELGCYGHTEAIANTLLIPDAGWGVADANLVPAMQIGATATAAGGRLAGTHPVTTKIFAISLGMGANMIGDTEETLVGVTPPGQPADTFTAHARHFDGDTAYGIDGETPTQVYSVSNALWSGVAGLGATRVPSTNQTNDFDPDGNPATAGPAGGGQPDPNWAAID